MCPLFFFTALLFATFIDVVVSGPISSTTQVWQQNAIEQSGYTSDPEIMEELSYTNKAIIEGDLRLTESRIAVSGAWLTKNIPYVISTELESRTEEIAFAMAILSEHTCVSFHLRTTERDYLVFRLGRGCSSFLGCIGGGQSLFLAPHCGVGSIVHEILHALGFHHEHIRKDRGQYVRVLHHNIKEGKEKNFHIGEGQTFNLPYDLSSIMHYGRYFFSRNGLPTLLPLDETQHIGQRAKMTAMDVEKVLRHYNCNKKEEKPRGETTTPVPRSTLHHEDATTRGKLNTSGLTTLIL